MIVKKIVSVLIIFFLLSMGINIFAASIGDQLVSPEEGWQRFDDNIPEITYVGTWILNEDLDGFYNQTQHHQNTKYSGIGIIHFKFYGTKIRIFAGTNDSCTRKATITIDGISEDYSNYNSFPYQNGNVTNTLVYEKTGLPLEMHSVSINTDATLTGDNGNNCLSIDSIDIDFAGDIINTNAPDIPVSLMAISGDSKIDLSWSVVTNASNYIVKRATILDGPYTTVTATADITFTDNTVTNGITYYYVVSAINSSGESANSSEVSATPIAPMDDNGNNAMLDITLSNGFVKEYDLTASELEDFLTWYDVRSEGTGKALYCFLKKNNIKPFISRKEYIVFDKILCIEVKEYKGDN